MIAGCDVQPSGVDDVRQIECDEYKLAEGAQACVSSVDYLVLDLPQEYVLGGIDKVIISEEKIYVGDYQSQKIYVFGLDGEMIAVLDKRGRGPGEYLQIQSFSVDAGAVFVLDQFETTVLSYNAETLEFLYAEKAPVPAWDFVALHDGGFLFAYAPLEGNPIHDRSRQYRVIVTDGRMRIKEKFFPYTDDETDAFSIAPYLSENGDTVIYGSFQEDGYCLFDRSDGHKKEQIKLKFTKPIPIGERSSISTIMGGRYTFITSVPHQSGNYCVLNLSIEGAGQVCVFDNKNEQFLQQSRGSMQNAILGVISSEGQYFIGNWRDKSIYEYMTKNGFMRAEPDKESAILAGVPFLVIYRVKE